EKELRSPEGRRRTAEEQINTANVTTWDDSISNLVQIKERADRMIRDTEGNYNVIMQKLASGAGFEDLNPVEKEVYNRYQNAGLELSDIQRHLSAQFEKAFKYAPEEHKKATQEELIKISNEYKEQLSRTHNLSGQSKVIDKLMRDLGPTELEGHELRRIRPPEVYRPVDDFAIDKTATTFANVALAGYKKFGPTAPIVSVENPPAGFGLARGEDLKNLIEKARAKFVETAVKGGMSESEARSAAEKTLGVTWDVGHINMLRKYGYSEKDIIKESEKIAPVLKHVHLSDNFGFEHTELPMGMGNVPIKEIMEKLGEKGYEAAKVIEAGQWWQHFKASPFQPTLETFGSPIYGIKMQPYWNQAVGTEGYFSGYGQMLPSINYETMGSGFSMLPAELGGQRQTAGRSRLSGNPME
ncbi:MAG TPA: sugar phosphate isomerase/epimerase, partial [Candidatus Omnitrophota bacterium]|nr:sugar phosphate isomerase/epimerase [Candidatus Omnitrophota bacterium]